MYNMDLCMPNRIALILFGLFISSFCFDRQGFKSSENYGPYHMQWHSAKLCKGPRAVNITREAFYFNKTSSLCLFNITFQVEARIDEVKTIVSSENNGARNILWSYRMKDPCNNFMVASMIRSSLRTENCVVKKGFYSCELNFNDSSKTFLGTSFFYGQFTFKSIITSKSGNIHCFETKVSFSRPS